MVEIIILAFAIMVLRRQCTAYGAGAGAAGPAATLVPPRKATAQLSQLSEYADRLFAEKKWLAAEKAYLSILKLDHKNVTAYSHLGIIYSTQKNLSDAIECFEIAARLRPGASTYQNLGLAFYENRNHVKAIAAFEKAIMFEPSVQRLIGLSRAYRKMSNLPQVISTLERAAALDATKRALVLLAEAYEDAKRPADAEATYRRIHELDPADAVAARKIGIHLPDSDAKLA